MSDQGPGAPDAARAEHDASHVAAGGHDGMHVVPPSWQPLLLAIGLTMTLAGTIVTPVMWIVGLALCIVASVNWLTELRRDYHPAAGASDSPD